VEGDSTLRDWLVLYNFFSTRGSPTITQTLVNVCSALCETMTSVYFPAHVFILFRRLVNVVSTLSISNHYISYSRQDDVPPTVSSKDASHLPRPPQAAWNLDWPWCTIRTTCDRALSDTIFEIRNLYSQGPVKGNWSGTWPRLFSFQPQLDGPPPESDPPPKKHGKEELKREGDEKSRLKESNDRPQHTASTERSHHTQPLPVDTIHQLLANPLLYDPLRTPRFPIVLCHGESISPSRPIRNAALLNLSITQVYMVSIPEVQHPSQV